MNAMNLPARLRFALPFTILAQPDVVRLVAGEEFRYTCRSPRLDQWLPSLLKNFEDEIEWRPLLHQIGRDRRQQAVELIARFYGERVLLEGNGQNPRPSLAVGWMIEGSGLLHDRLQGLAPRVANNAADIAILCQDSLDYAVALDFNQRCRHARTAGWLWISSGAMNRAFVSPVFRPDAGPCLNCLLRNFRRLSPVPEIYDDLIAHARTGGKILAVPFPAAAIEVIVNLVRWKIEESTCADVNVGTYRLHVLETDTMESTGHRVFRDPECPDCSR